MKRITLISLLLVSSIGLGHNLRVPQVTVEGPDAICPANPANSTLVRSGIATSPAPLTTQSKVKGKSTSTQVGAVYARTSYDRKSWKPPKVVSWAGQSGDDLDSAGHPCVVEVQPGSFYLFRTQRPGASLRTSVNHSTDPLDFGIYGNHGDAARY